MVPCAVVPAKTVMCRACSPLWPALPPKQDAHRPTMPAKAPHSPYKAPCRARIGQRSREPLQALVGPHIKPVQLTRCARQPAQNWCIQADRHRQGARTQAETAHTQRTYALTRAQGMPMGEQASVWIGLPPTHMRYKLDFHFTYPAS